MILGSLFGGGGGPKSPKEMGYKPSSGFQALIDYKGTPYNAREAAGFSDTLFDAVNAGSLDPGTALSMVESRIQPGSGYYKSKEFKDLLDYRMDDERARGIIGDAFATNYFRPGKRKEIEAFYLAAENAGVTGNPNELRNFMTQRLARTPEGESKRPFDAFQLEKAAYYGAPVRDTEGRNLGQYAVFGRGEEGAKRVAEARSKRDEADDFLKNQLAKMGIG